ncbi:MAG: hypothetical protein K0U84_14385 [Actinomycetia bacterium]|nr:hypothetical protein [Actinomycetes bacterium]
MTTSSLTDPSAFTPSQWAARLAALKSRFAADDDPRVTECRAALSFWRTRRVIDREVDQLAPGGVEALIDRLRGVSA